MISCKIRDIESQDICGHWAMCQTREVITSSQLRSTSSESNYTDLKMLYYTVFNSSLLIFLNRETNWLSY